MYEEIKGKATKTLKWATLGQFVARAFQPLVLLILARILDPGEYGILEISILVVMLAQMLQDFGLSRALIQTDSDPQLAANIIFWINLGLSFIIFTILFFTAPAISCFFDEPSATTVIRVAGLQLPILAIGTIQMALAQRELQYQRQFLAHLLGAITMTIFAISMVYIGFGVWSFIIGSLVGSVVQTSAYWIISPWRLSKKADIALARRLISFGFFVTLEVLLGWFFSYGDNLIIGHYLGVNKLGLYALAFNITIFGMGLVINPVISVSFSSFSRLQIERDELIRAFFNVVEFTALLVLPMVVVLIVLAESFTHVVLGENWLAIAPVIRILAISPGLAYMVAMNSEIYKAIGRPDIMPRLLLVVMTYSVPAYIVGAQFGLIGFALSRFSVGVIFLPVHVILASRVLEISPRYIWDAMKTPLFGALGMSLFLVGSQFILLPFDGWLGWVKLIILIASGIGIYTLVIGVVDRQLFRKTLRLVREAL